jgi:hypothetical protein
MLNIAPYIDISVPVITYEPTSDVKRNEARSPIGLPLYVNDADSAASLRAIPSDMVLPEIEYNPVPTDIVRPAFNPNAVPEIEYVPDVNDKLYPCTNDADVPEIEYEPGVNAMT